MRGHVAAFTAWNGVPRVLLYDNLKSVVLDRRGDAIRFHPTLLGFALLIRAAERGANLGAITAALMRLLERTAAADLQLAILEALERDVPHPNAVRLALERRREQRGDTPQIAVVLPAHVQARDAPVRPHRLETYDQLKERSDD